MTREVSASMQALMQRIDELHADNEVFKHTDNEVFKYADNKVFKAPRSERRSRNKKIAKLQLGKKRQSSER